MIISKTIKNIEKKVVVKGHNIELYTPDQTDYEHFLTAAKFITEVVLDYETFVLVHQTMEIEYYLFTFDAEETVIEEK